MFFSFDFFEIFFEGDNMKFDLWNDIVNFRHMTLMADKLVDVYGHSTYEVMDNEYNTIIVNLAEKYRLKSNDDSVDYSDTDNILELEYKLWGYFKEILNSAEVSIHED